MKTFRGDGALDDAAAWRRLKEILANALEQPTHAARLASVHEACGDDAGLSRAAEQLLEFDTHHLDEFAEFVTTHLRGDDANRIGERLGAYVIEQEIDRGGMGAVYLGKRADGHFEKQVAIKIIKRGTDTDEALRRFQLERQILAQLDHPNITRLLDAGATSDGLPYFVMEYVRGTPITRYVREQKLDLRARLAIFVKVCRAVAAAHESQTIHRDIKPGNVLVRTDGEPKLLDFGIAKSIAPETNASDATVPRESRLTSSYASPEQIAGENATARSDIYSLGALLRELIKDERADQTLHEIIERATRTEPGQRFDSATAFADAVERYLRGETDRRGTKTSWRVLARTIAALLLLGVATYFWMQRAHVSHAPAAQTDAIRSIAVLPFEPLGIGDDNQLLGLGMADAIIGRICTLQDLLVLPTAAVTRFKGPAQDAIGAARDLNVDAVLSGTVQRAENRVRVTVQLVRASTRQTMWAQKFDQTFTDIFAIQDSISEGVARAIARNVRPADEDEGKRRRPSNSAAYESYLRGLSLYSQRTKDALQGAIEQFRVATEADPQYALAYALMSDCQSLLFYYKYNTSPELLRVARSSAEKALSLDDSLPEAHLAIAMAQTNEQQIDLATKSLRHAVELNPNLALARQRYAWRLCGNGDLPETVVQMRRAQELDPLSPTDSTALGIVLALARDYDGALYYCQRAAVLNSSEPFIQQNLGTTHELKGQFEEAIACFRKMAELRPALEGDALAGIAHVYYSAGEREKADAMMPRILQLAGEEKVDPYNVVLLYTINGDKDRALEWLATMLKKAPTAPGLLRYDPELDALRSDPRFAEVLRKNGAGDLLKERKG